MDSDFAGMKMQESVTNQRKRFSRVALFINRSIENRIFIKSDEQQIGQPNRRGINLPRAIFRSMYRIPTAFEALPRTSPLNNLRQVDRSQRAHRVNLIANRCPYSTCELS
jgi:hypothetical protein